MSYPFSRFTNAVLKNKTALKEFHRYFWAGCLAFGSDFVVLALLTSGLGIHYLISNVFGFLAGLTVSYSLAVKWVFLYRRLENHYYEFLIFAAIAFLGLLVSELALWLLVEFISMHYLVAKVIVAWLVFTLNFALKKTALFVRPK